MKKFFFFNKSDLDKQPIHVTYANNLQEAIGTFAKLKVLNINSFLQIFEVKEYKK